MLPPFIIEQIRKREEQERRRDNRPVIQLPLPSRPMPARPQEPVDDEVDRGVIIIDLA